MRTGRGPERDSRGQSTVEFALIMPLVVFVLLMALQVTVLAISQLGATASARHIARSVAVDPGADINRLTAHGDRPGENGMSIMVQFVQAPTTDREMVCVLVERPVDAVFPLFERFLKDFNIRAEAKMLLER